LWSAFYAFLHLLAFLTFILGWNFERLAKELLERPYIFVGFVALTGLVPLVVTSNRTSMRYLGRRWVRLHRLVYVILVLALLHMLWVVRSDLGRWLIYAVPGVVLLAVRFPVMVRLLSLNARAGKPK
jgi:sulfoxide reductase heme-binding subunit YedZ